MMDFNLFRIINILVSPFISKVLFKATFLNLLMMTLKPLIL